MRNLFKFASIAFAFGLLFVGAESVNAQSWRTVQRERREYRENVQDARRDYRNDIRRGENPYAARREYRDEVRDARRDYRRDTRGNYWNRSYYNRGYYPYNRYGYNNYYRRPYRSGVGLYLRF